jgi:hypothetical protein
LCLCQPLPGPYVPIEDEVQEEVSKMKNLQIKTLLKKNTTLNFPVWHDNGTKEAFLMHARAVLDAIKKHGHFKNYKKAQNAYVEHKQVVKSAKASLSLLDRTSEGLGKLHKSKKAKKAEVKANEAKAMPKEAKGATKVPKDPVKANFQANLEKAKKVAKDAKGAMTTATRQMFAFYANQFSPESKYTWNKNKIVVEQMEATHL